MKCMKDMKRYNDGIELVRSLNFCKISELFDITTTGPVTFVGIDLTLAGLVACVVPSARAMRVNPMTALRHE